MKIDYFFLSEKTEKNSPWVDDQSAKTILAFASLQMMENIDRKY
jgi:hypothetical protein